MKFMSSLKCFLYITWNDSAYRVGISHDPMLDLKFLQQKGYRQMQILSQALPVGLAYFLREQVADAREKHGKPYVNAFARRKFMVKQAAKLWLRNEWKHPVEKIIDSIHKRLKRHGEKLQANILPPQGVISAEEAADYVLPGSADLHNLREVLSGRLLFLEEIERALVEQGKSVQAHLETVLQLLFLQGELDFYPGITWEGNTLRCYRCGQSSGVRQTQCLNCGNHHCYYCEECIATGESRLCKPLYGRKVARRVVRPRASYRVKLDFSLTRAQKDAAVALKKFVREEQAKECLVWAVCGAGKTEVAFWAVAEALNDGGRVLCVSPRKDVIMELLPRFESAFPEVERVALHGAQREKFATAPLILATTHQAIRFYSRFDLVVLDEVDAYPYQGSAMLHHAVERATRPGGKMVYLTATPAPRLLSSAREGLIKLVRIPARHHGYPLPEPELMVEKALTYDAEGRVMLPSKVMDLVHRTVEGDLAQLFVFVPSVFLAQRVGEALQRLVGQPPFNDFGGEWVQYSHSKDPLREEKRRRFSRGDFPIFVTTTIMERGITVPRANVMILFAEKERIFDTGTLVQMAGRAGRSEENPCGRVWFIGSKISGSMKTAVEWIKEMNQEAFHLGYFHEKVYRREQVKEVKYALGEDI